MQHGKVSPRDVPRIRYRLRLPTACMPAPGPLRPMQAIFDKHLPRWREDNTAPALRDRYSAGGDRERACRRPSGCCWREVAKRTGMKLREQHLHHRLCAARRDLQARRPAVYRSGAAGAHRAERGRHADSVRRQGASRTMSRASRSSGTSLRRRSKLASGALHIVYLAELRMAVWPRC